MLQLLDLALVCFHQPTSSDTRSAKHFTMLTCACRYRHTSYHKQTKNQWARDDPAFLVVTCCLLTAAASAYCVACGSPSCVFIDVSARRQLHLLEAACNEPRNRMSCKI